MVVAVGDPLAIGLDDATLTECDVVAAVTAVRGVLDTAHCRAVGSVHLGPWWFRRWLLDDLSVEHLSQLFGSCEVVSPDIGAHRRRGDHGVHLLGSIARSHQHVSEEPAAQL